MNIIIQITSAGRNGYYSTSDNGLPLIMVHAITKPGPWASRDARGFLRSLRDGSNPEDNGKKGKSRVAGTFGYIGNRRDIYFLFLLAGPNCHGGLFSHAATTHSTLLMESLERRLAPRQLSKPLFGENKDVIFLDSRLVPPWVCLINLRSEFVPPLNKHQGTYVERFCCCGSVGGGSIISVKR